MFCFVPQTDPEGPCRFCRLGKVIVINVSMLLPNLTSKMDLSPLQMTPSGWNSLILGNIKFVGFLESVGAGGRAHKVWWRQSREALSPTDTAPTKLFHRIGWRRIQPEMFCSRMKNCETECFTQCLRPGISLLVALCSLNEESFEKFHNFSLSLAIFAV